MSSKFRITSNYQSKRFNQNLTISKRPARRLAFNFSFLTPDRNYNLQGKQIEKNIKAKLLDKIYYLSQKDIVDLFSHDDKYNGLEKLPESEVSLRFHPLFKKTRYDDCETGFWVFQLNKKGRVIGKKNRNLFYIMSIDTKFKQYQH